MPGLGHLPGPDAAEGGERDEACGRVSAWKHSPLEVLGRWVGGADVAGLHGADGGVAVAEEDELCLRVPDGMRQLLKVLPPLMDELLGRSAKCGL